VLPAPAAVPVDRFVGIGLVGPCTLRPVCGVCASSSSRPVPPALRFVDERARFGDGRDRRAFACGFFAAAVFRAVRRPAFRARLRPAPLRADARAAEPARLFDRVRFRRLLDPVRAAPPARRFAAFLAMVSTPCNAGAHAPGRR